MAGNVPAEGSFVAPAGVVTHLGDHDTFRDPATERFLHVTN